MIVRLFCYALPIFFAAPCIVLSAQVTSAAPSRNPPLPNSPGVVASVPIGSQAPQSSVGTASVFGTVLDGDGAQIANASIVLEDLLTRETRSVRAGDDGSFTFLSLPPSTFRVTVSAEGFAPWNDSNVITHTGESLQLPQIALEVSPLNSSVDAITQYQAAELEMKVEEKQRVLGIVPNFFVTYNWLAPPMTSRQKYRLALHVEIDPFNYIGSGVIAGIEQATNTFPGYGEGASGFAKRYGAVLADGFTGTMLGGAVFPSLLHQDPRYFYKGSGTITSRALYAIATVVICKGDNGKWQPNYSSVLGNLASAGISNVYYPASDRHGAGVVIDNALIGTAGGAIGSLMQEFFLRRIMLGSAPRPQSAPDPSSK